MNLSYPETGLRNMEHKLFLEDNRRIIIICWEKLNPNRKDSDTYCDNKTNITKNSTGIQITDT